MVQYEETNFAERTEVVVVILVIGVSYFLVIVPVLGDLTPMFAVSGMQTVEDRFLNSPRDLGLVLYLFVGLWSYVRIRKRVIGPFETLGGENG